MSELQILAPVSRVTARALLLGDRIDVAGLERADAISTSPLAFHVGQGGKVALYRYGVAVMVGLSPLEEEDILARLKDRVVGARLRKEDEIANLRSARRRTASRRSARSRCGTCPTSAFCLRRHPGEERGARPRRARGQFRVRQDRAARQRAWPARTADARPPRNAAADRAGARRAAPRFRPRRGRRQARRAVGPSRPRTPLCASRGRIRAQGARPDAAATSWTSSSKRSARSPKSSTPTAPPSWRVAIIVLIMAEIGISLFEIVFFHAGIRPFRLGLRAFRRKCRRLAPVAFLPCGGAEARLAGPPH